MRRGSRVETHSGTDNGIFYLGLDTGEGFVSQFEALAALRPISRAKGSRAPTSPGIELFSGREALRVRAGNGSAEEKGEIGIGTPQGLAGRYFRTLQR